MSLSTQDLMLIEQRVTNEAKSVGVAYLLWLFFGAFGGHRFYLERPLSALLMPVLSIIGWATLPIGLGAFVLIAVGVWMLIDAFLIPSMVSRQKGRVRAEMITRMKRQRGGASVFD